jgi:hypothetical protein
MQAKTCVKLDHFQNITAITREKMRNNDFCDVTLVSKDNKRLGAHKVILASSSTFFRNMLVNEKHHHPLVFMRGVEHIVLEALLDFIYSGEAKLDQKHMNSFKMVCIELEVFVITGKETDKEKSISYISELGESKMCNHCNKGFCNQTKCQFLHVKEDCKTHLSGYVCKKKDCKMRHRKICRYWCKDGCRRKGNCSYLHQETHMKNEHKKYTNTSPEDESKRGNGKDESEKVLKCQLCNEVLDDNDDIKKHYIIQHMAHLKKIRGCSKCEVEYCMEIQGDSCSQFCFYYKNLLGFEVKKHK